VQAPERGSMNQDNGVPAAVLPQVPPVANANVRDMLIAAGGPAAEVQTFAELVGNPANRLDASRDWCIVSQLPGNMAHNVSDDERGRFKLRSVAADNACAAAAFPMAHAGVAGVVAALQPLLQDIGQQLAARGQQLDHIEQELAAQGQQLAAQGQQLAAQGQQLQNLTDQVQQTRAKVRCSFMARLHH
jgi:hypothetical protein